MLKSILLREIESTPFSTQVGLATRRGFPEPVGPRLEAGRIPWTRWGTGSNPRPNAGAEAVAGENSSPSPTPISRRLNLNILLLFFSYCLSV